jgi:methylmalonyl-CoA/ethylmalonyl-CoA epimerase
MEQVTMDPREPVAGEAFIGPACALDIRHHHGSLSVAHLEASIQWFCRMFGFEQESLVELPHLPARVAMLRKGALRIELFEVVGSRPASPERRVPDEDLKTRGTKHFAFAVRNVNAAAEELRARGADVVFVKELPFASFAFIRDNDGNLIELLQQPDLF